jgi:hypothetical protein
MTARKGTPKRRGGLQDLTPLVRSDVNVLISAQAVSTYGSFITRAALPLLAILGLGINAAGLQDLDRPTGETALREIGVALHEEQHVAGFDQLVNTLLGVTHDGAPKVRCPYYFTLGVGVLLVTLWIEGMQTRAS